ncbi:GDSL-type esterase/lipase family protein [Acidobacteriota bacterium]
MGARRLARLTLFIIYFLVYGFVYAGWLFHRSQDPVVHNYSGRYLGFLAVMLLFFFLPWPVSRIIRTRGMKKLLFIALPVCVTFVVIYGVASLRYYHTVVHHFDPFLQVSGPCQDSQVLEKRHDTYRILALGGSTTYCGYLNEPDRYPRVVESVLRQHYPGRDIEVINAGMSWYTTRHTLIHYATACSDLEPDMIIVMHAINDLCRSFSPPKFALGRYSPSFSHYYGPSINGANPPSFEKYCYQRYLQSSLHPFTSAWYSSLRIKVSDLPLSHYRSIDMFEKNLKKIIHYAERDGVSVIVVTQPYLYKEDMNREEISALELSNEFCATGKRWLRIEYPSPSSLRQAMSAFNERAKKVARAESAILIDAEPLIEKDLDHLWDNVHYTKAGSKKLGECVANEIITHRLIEDVAVE